MPRMIDLIRSNAVPATLVQSAARGALSIPPVEMLEILVYLAGHNPIFGAQARMTLAGWDEKSAIAAAGNPKTPQEVLDYLIAPENLRPKLLPALLENSSVRDETLMVLAVSGSKEIAEAMLASPRVNQNASIWNALSTNPNAGSGSANKVVEETVPLSRPQSTDTEVATPAEPAGEPESEVGEAAAAEGGLDDEIAAYLNEHAAEIEAEAGKPFQPIGGMPEEAPAVEVAAEEKPVAASAVASPVARAQRREETEAKRGSALQKISKLDIKGRIQLAMKGNKEERSILIRDGTKIVALAVLDSPKITDGEVEAFASQKNVLEAVLRGIPMKRRFAKHYPVIRNLVFNPRTPLDLSLGLMKNILVNDLRNLSANKEVSDTVRKLATKMFKQKSDTSKKHTD